MGPEKGSSKKGARRKKGARKGPQPAHTKRSARAPKKAVRPTPSKQARAPRAQSKGAQILEMIGGTQGATLAEIRRTTGWQAHSVRGFLSTAAKKHGLQIESIKTETGDRLYQIKK